MGGWAMQVGDGVFGFTLDMVIGEFVMSHNRIQIPDGVENGQQRIYSGNQGNVDLWAPELKKYVEEVLQAGPKPYTYRYIGASAAAPFRFRGEWGGRSSVSPRLGGRGDESAEQHHD
jgi:fructose-1,6-bisphosphatase